MLDWGLTSALQVFMNLVLDEAFEEKPGGEKVAAGMVVRTRHSPIRRLREYAKELQVIRGNSIVMLEALERISEK